MTVNSKLYDTDLKELTTHDTGDSSDGIDRLSFINTQVCVDM
jgi:hypothetical protein